MSYIILKRAKHLSTVYRILILNTVTFALGLGQLPSERKIPAGGKFFADFSK